MVGHTGDFNAGKRAAQTVDRCLSKLVPLLQEKEYEIIIIADHGNSDYMINEDGSPNTAHSKNPVPIVYIGNRSAVELKNGALRDVAPTLLNLMTVEVPSEMTGRVLISNY